MSWEEFERMPMELGWKYEYWDGQAHITPRAQLVTVTVELKARRAHCGAALRGVDERDEEELASLYLAAFRDTVEYCDWESPKIAASARQNIRSFFAGRRGEPLPASRVAVGAERGGAGRLVGAALVVGSEESPPLLDMLFVAPEWQRRGMGTALVSAAINDLRGAGKQILESRYLLANEESKAWHRKFGFVEEQDLFLARLYYRHAAHELERRELIGDLPEEEHRTLTLEVDRRRAEADRLEAIAKEHGMEAVLPVLRSGAANLNPRMESGST